MDRRKFLQRMAISASLAVASPLLSEAAGNAADTNTDHEKSTAGQLQSSLSKGFVDPPESAAPWVFWLWMGVDTTPAAITYDLEQMKAKGIAGFIIYGNQAGSMPREIPARVLTKKNNRFEYEFVKNGDYDNFYTTPIPFPSLQSWTPLWRERMRYVAREAARLDLKFCLNIGMAGTSAHISEEYGNQELIWTETSVSGPATFDGILPAIEQHHRQSGYRRDVAVLAIPDTPDFIVDKVVNLSAKMNQAGHLRWDVLAGSWKILRFSQAATGLGNGWGIFSDAMNPEATDKVWEVNVAPLLEEMLPQERKGLIGLEDDSWEGGAFTWTKNFPEEFKKRRGYDLIPYLPILTSFLPNSKRSRYDPTAYSMEQGGIRMADPAVPQQIERDYKLTVSDMTADYHYGRLERLCHKNGLIFFSEAAGPNLHQADLLKTTSKVDLPMAEFWMPCFHRPTPKSRYLSRNAACASHIYGMPINMDEAFTSMGPEWEDSPFSMKPVGDQAFCDGVNRICIHNFSHSPSPTAKPGYVYAPGTHYDPGITWWEQVPAFNTYLARCSYMLQQGKFVADAIFYEGDNIGDGEPMKELHSTLGMGYDYDRSNADVLLHRMSVKDGRIMLPDGMSYRVLILPDHQPMALHALQKVAQLIEAGATVIGPQPIRLAGLSLRSDEVQQFDALVARLWGGKFQNASATKRKFGAGYLVVGQSARQTLQDAGVPPDFEYTGLSAAGEIHWIHRRTENADIYFVSSHWQPEESLECAFRVSGKQPELWDPVSGTIRDAVAFRQSGGRTIVPLEFAPCGSVFVVFRKPISSDIAGKAATNYPRNVQVQLALSGPWEVSFDPRWGGPKRITFDTLLDWTRRPEPGIRYYSGTAVYRKTFNLPHLPSRGKQFLLDLGELHEVGSVRLNGRYLGVIWTKPARVDITDAVRRGSNHLEVTVVNLWPNRLIGDAGLPPDKQFTHTNIHKFSSHSPLLPSGLIGPVKILSTDDPGSVKLT